MLPHLVELPTELRTLPISVKEKGFAVACAAYKSKVLSSPEMLWAAWKVRREKMWCRCHHRTCPFSVVLSEVCDLLERGDFGVLSDVTAKGSVYYERSAFGETEQIKAMSLPMACIKASTTESSAGRSILRLEWMPMNGSIKRRSAV
jgi:hypothetical protein